MIRIILGVVFLIVAVGLLLVFLQMPENETATNFMESLHCDPGETLLIRQGQYVYSTSTSTGGRSISYSCLNVDAVERDVTGPVVLTLIAAFVVPFLLSLGLFMSGIFGIVRSKTRKLMSGVMGGVAPGTPGANMSGFGVGNSPFGDTAMPGTRTTASTVVTVDGKQANLSSLPPQTARILQQTLGKLGISLDEMQGAARTGSTGGGAQGDLASRLQQLQEAYDKGLITREEFDSTRQAILDSLDD